MRRHNGSSSGIDWSSILTGIFLGSRSARDGSTNQQGPARRASHGSEGDPRALDPRWRLPGTEWTPRAKFRSRAPSLKNATPAEFLHLELGPAWASGVGPA